MALKKMGWFGYFRNFSVCEEDYFQLRLKFM